MNGPNLNMLGMREPDIYGHETLGDIEAQCRQLAAGHDMELDWFQSNFEGELITKIHEAIDDSIGIIINAGALTHTSIGIFDALNMFNKPIIEIHITNVYARESFRHKSYISAIATGVIAGLGVNSYLLAIEAVNKLVND